MSSVNDPEVSRNFGFWNEAEQEALFAGCVAIAGVGGDGFQLGQKLAMNGVRSFRIADPEVFEPENINRVPGARQSTLGQNKADTFRDAILEINPDAEVTVFDEGISEDNIYDFLQGATLAYDETELTLPHLGTMLAREARRRNIPNVLVMNIGFAAQVTSFDPKSKATFERFMGIPVDMPLSEVAKRKVQLDRCLPYLPKYGDLRSLIAVEGGASLPSIAQGVDVASAIGATQAFLHLTRGVNNRRPDPVWAPKIAWMDAYSMQTGSTRHPRLSHYRHLGHAVARHYLGRNPRASYTDADRQRREDERSSR